MTQKVLKVGTSAAVIIPRDFLKELGLSIGDRVDVQVNRKRRILHVAPTSKKTKVDIELLNWTRKFIEEYRPALEALAKK